MPEGRPSQQIEPQRIEVAIVGAGIAGLTAAVGLRQAGRTVLVIDKGRGVGGRLATRRIGDATFDHGAQFITAREPGFAAALEEWSRKGIVKEWYRSAGDGPDPHPRWRGIPSMTGIAKHLAADVPLLLGTRVTSLRRTGRQWSLETDGGETVGAEAVLLTAPVPQSLEMLQAVETELPPDTLSHLKGIRYERCLAVLAIPLRAPGVPEPGCLAPTEGPIAWIADNQRKGVSKTPAVTIHASPEYSLENWDRDRKETGMELLMAAKERIGSSFGDFHVHGWRYSRPLRLEETLCLVVQDSPLLVLAGDAFGGPRVEGAALSGRAAVGALGGTDAGSE